MRIEFALATGTSTVVTSFSHFKLSRSLLTFDGASYLFSEASTERGVGSSGSNKDTLPGHSWLSDHALYHGFLALNDLMLVILASRNSLGQRSSAEDSLPSSLDEVLRDVESRISSAREHVKQVLPCEFRLEVLENAFALLFARSEHLTEAGRCLAESIKSLDAADSEINQNEARRQNGREVSAERTSCGDRRKKVVCQKMSLQKDNRSSETASDEQRAARLSVDEMLSVEQKDDGCTAPGFLVSSSVILNILTMMQECLNDLDAQLQEYSLSTEGLNGTGHCSLHQRCRKLCDYVTEALWRHKLVAPHDAFQSDERGGLSTDWRNESDGTSGMEIISFED